jgi:hypothetical protein
MGFVKAFDLTEIAQFTKEISKPIGSVWAFTGILFLIAVLLYIMKKDAWPIVALIALVLSQFLIFSAWSDAKYGTIANAIILVISVTGFADHNFHNTYKKDVVAAMEKMTGSNTLVTENDLTEIPLSVQNYLRYVGVVGKPKVRNVRIVFEGEMRNRGQDWFKFTSEQYSFFDDPTRLFFMKAKVKGLATSGYHAYKMGDARMQVKVLSLFPVVDIDKPELFKTETVTFFNDLCLFAPAALIDDRITWETIDSLSVKATYKNNGTSISAVLYFNEKGQLVNFVSKDRISVDEMKTYPFSTPASNYQNVNGFNLPTYGEAVWHYTDGEFVYGKFNLKSVAYNVSL